jgi:hypothetical protein
MFLSHRMRRLEVSLSGLYFCGDFSNAPTSCSVKYLRGYKLFFELISIIDLTEVLLAPFSVSTAAQSPVLRADSLPIARWS